MNKIFLLIIIASCIAGIGITPAHAQNTEVQYPTLPNGVRLTLQPTLPEFILYIYYFLLASSGFIVFGSLIWGGIEYLTSGANPTLQTKAKQRISGALVGVIVLSGSYLLLSTINPQLRIFHIEKQIASQPCDCSNPSDGFCKKLCAPLPERIDVGEQVLEVPLGNIIERIINKETLEEFDAIAIQSEKFAKNARDKAKAYKDELDQCRCSRNTVIPHCSAAPQCVALQCTGEPCDTTALANKKKALQDANAVLAAYVEEHIGLNISSASGMPPSDPSNPGAPTGSGGRCAFGRGACSPSSLSAFGSKAGEASQICQKESGGTESSLNDGCLTGNYDYSVGLFQINLFNTGRCDAAFEKVGKDAKGNWSTCRIIRQDILDECMERYGYGNAEKNIQAALGISGGGSNWCPWTTANSKNCNLCAR